MRRGAAAGGPGGVAGRAGLTSSRGAASRPCHPRRSRGGRWGAAHLPGRPRRAGRHAAGPGLRRGARVRGSRPVPRAQVLGSCRGSGENALGRSGEAQIWRRSAEPFPAARFVLEVSVGARSTSGNGREPPSRLPPAQPRARRGRRPCPGAPAAGGGPAGGGACRGPAAPWPGSLGVGGAWSSLPRAALRLCPALAGRRVSAGVHGGVGRGAAREQLPGGGEGAAGRGPR